MDKRFLILDCFVDEPACFGVPPFISPYPRYVYGALADAGIPREHIEYRTVEQLREKKFEIEPGFDLVILIGGAVVPGKYLGHKIGTVPEIRRIITENPRVRFAIGGMVSRMPDIPGSNRVFKIEGDIEKFAFGYAQGNPVDGMRTYDELRRWSAKGTPLAAMHPGFPNVICEIETSRGCPRQAHCSFCSEGMFPGVEFRGEEAILEEIDGLIRTGVSRFRLGRQADIIQYGTVRSEFRGGFPRPNSERALGLFSALRERSAKGDIRVLNIDNGNPGSIYNFPEESARILEAIAGTVTPGDTLALGVESLDDKVIARNNLKVGAAGLAEVVRIINRIGGGRVGGIPRLLPGINLIHGLPGETADTFRINYECLNALKEEGLLVKRINIRKVLPFPGTRLYGDYREPSLQVRNRYEYYKEKIRTGIDHYMLSQIYPAGTVLREVLVEERRFEYALAKQIASYSITAKIPLPLAVGCFADVMVIGHRERSVIALPYPVDVNTLPQKALELIPGIGRRNAGEIILRRPVKSVEEITSITPSVPAPILEAMRFHT